MTKNKQSLKHLIIISLLCPLSDAFAYNNPCTAIFGSSVVSPLQHHYLQYPSRTYLNMISPNEDSANNIESEEVKSTTSMHVEGLNFDKREDEILAMGGDPFFLNDDEDESIIDSDVDEEEDVVMPSMSLMSSISSLPNVIDYVEKKMESEKSDENVQSSTKTEKSDKNVQSSTKTRLELLEERKEELLDIGGDPAFLDDETKEETDDDSSDVEWDGWPVEDAHEDFY